MADQDNDLFRAAIARLQKQSMAPAEQIGAAPPPPPPAPPVDPATGQPMPMDPAAGGMPPVDPATGQPMPMDPAMMGGMPPMDPSMMPPPGEDPLIKMLSEMSKKIGQLHKMVATISDQLGVKMPLGELLEEGEDPLEEAMAAPAGPEKAAMWVPRESGGVAAAKPSYVKDIMDRDPAAGLSAAARVAQRALARHR